MRGRALVGTSGWIYDHWRGRFYPEDLPARRWLAHVGERFNTVEVNATFYRLQRPSTFERWRAEVPPGFVFAVKASRYVTHLRKLGGGRAPLANFFAQGLLRLGRALGPILWQLPAQARFDAERARVFLSALPVDVAAAEQLAAHHDERLAGRAALCAPDGTRARLRHALEARHPSWFAPEALALLAAHDVALAASDAPDFPCSLARTSRRFAYVRLHGSRQKYASRYTDEELDEWAEQISSWLDGGADVYVYFDNDFRAHAPSDALRLRARLDGSRRQSPTQRAQRNPMSMSR
jgi:uncharacterized protein YecE (DUF72 family)